jgi:diguanylate cyclase (GGDEF)-like protein/PAS domain S-box-containing protein
VSNIKRALFNTVIFRTFKVGIFISMFFFQPSFVKSFITASLSMSVLLIIIVGGFFFTDYQSELKIITERERSQTLLGAKLIEHRLDNVARDVLILANSISLHRYGRYGLEESIVDLGHEFRNTSCLKGIYDQVRFIDKTGEERVRVNYREGECLLVAKDELQNKKTRYYFSDTYKLKKGQIFISPLDLNIEHGAIEHPLKPMIRIGTPVLTNENDKFGIVLVNYFGKELINDLSAAMSGSNGVPMLLNRDGYWLLGEHSDDEWGFMFNRNEKRMGNKNPETWRMMSNTAEGQIRTESGIFTWRTVYPLSVNSISSTGSKDASGQSLTYIDREDYFWKVVTHIPQDQITDLQYRRVRMALILISLLLLLAVFAAYFIGRSRERELVSIAALKESEHRQRAITAKLAEGLIVLDNEGKLITMNPEAERLLGWTFGILAEQRIHDLIHAHNNDDSEHDCPILNVLRDEKIYHIEEEYFCRADGSMLPVAYTASPYIVNDEISGVIVVFQDISERKKLREELIYQATHDVLTGLLNRREVENILSQIFKQAKRYEHALSVCMIDIDHFKKINDAFGHRAGDETIKKIGLILDQNTRNADLAGRYGGEEFVVALTETPLAGALQWAEQLRSTIESSSITFSDSMSPIEVTVSIGVASISDEINNPDQLIDSADRALYLAKDSGRNRVAGDNAELSTADTTD